MITFIKQHFVLKGYRLIGEMANPMSEGENVQISLKDLIITECNKVIKYY